MAKNIDFEKDFYGRPLIKIVSPVYDDIVDKSDYKPDSENKRAARSVGTAGEKGLYDFEPDENSDFKKVSSSELLLRTGKVDKADVQKLKEEALESAASDVDKKKDLQKLEEAEQRSRKVDEILGVKSESD